jgi:hypothetical protein
MVIVGLQRLTVVVAVVRHYSGLVEVMGSVRLMMCFEMRERPSEMTCGNKSRMVSVSATGGAAVIKDRWEGLTTCWFGEDKGKI